MKIQAAGRFLVGIWLPVICCAISLPLQAQIRGGMLDPAVTDPPGEPFSYFWHPTDMIGALYAPVATEVTPEGYLYTGFGELMFFTGNPPEPVNQRIKTLYKGYLPIVQYEMKRDGVGYRFRMFGVDLGGGLQGLPVNFVEVHLQNDTSEERTAFVSAAYRFSPPNGGLGSTPDYRFRQRFDLIPARYTEDQTTFDPHWTYSFGRNALLRSGRLLYIFPDQPQPAEISLSMENNGLRMYRFFNGPVQGSPSPAHQVDAHTPMGVVLYRVLLKPGESKSLVFKMPIVPIPEGTPEAQQVEHADYGEVLEQTASTWEGLVGNSSPLQFPEAKVQQALLANTVTHLLDIDKVGNDYIPMINKFQYHQFWGGAGTSHMLVALDYLGHTDIAGKAALYTIQAQSPEGAYLSIGDNVMRRYWEMFGNNMWTWERHYLLTRDSTFLHEVYPSVVKAMTWEELVTHQDPLGIMPIFAVADDAGLKDVHQTGQDLWTLAGIQNAIAMARAMGKSQDVEDFTAEYQRFRKAFDKQLAIQTAKTGGYIPPALDQTLKGNNWDNLLTLYPEPLFDPFDLRVTATIQESRKTYAEGILGYVWPSAIAKEGNQYIFDTAPRLHYWQSLSNAENGLVRGDPQDQELAVKDLYAMLLHTTSTHQLQEFGTYPWSTRDYIYNDILPDSVSSGVLVELMRNMLVREYHSDLYLFSAISPDWLRTGQQIVVRKEPSDFGPMSATLTAAADGWKVQLSNQFRNAPEHLIITIPWFYDVSEVEADGHPTQVTGGKLILSPRVHEVQVRGRIKPGTPMFSYESTVEDYKREYKQRYEEFLRTGLTEP